MIGMEENAAANPSSVNFPPISTAMSYTISAYSAKFCFHNTQYHTVRTMLVLIGNMYLSDIVHNLDFTLSLHEYSMYS